MFGTNERSLLIYSNMLFTFGKHDRKYTNQYKIDNNKIIHSDVYHSKHFRFFFRFFTSFKSKSFDKQLIMIK